MSATWSRSPLIHGSSDDGHPIPVQFPFCLTLSLKVTSQGCPFRPPSRQYWRAAPRRRRLNPPGHHPTVISIAAGRRFFLRVCSCKSVGLRREKPRFVFSCSHTMPRTPAQSTIALLLPRDALKRNIQCTNKNLSPAPPSLAEKGGRSPKQGRWHRHQPVRRHRLGRKTFRPANSGILCHPKGARRFQSLRQTDETPPRLAASRGR